jgi:hypothetical protein
MPVATVIDPAVFAPDIDGFYWEATCGGSAAKARECSLAGTKQSGADWETTGVTNENLFTVNGVEGQKYVLTLDIRGVVGTRCYQGGQRRSADPVNAAGANDALYVGGTPGGEGWWNTFEVHVEAPAMSNDANDYYLNAFEQTYDNQDYEKCNSPSTYEVNYQFELAVMGDSTVRFRLHDYNGNAIQNCGSGADTEPCAPRSVDMTGVTPAPTVAQPVNNQPVSGTYYPQWIYIDVVSVAEAQ